MQLDEVAVKRVAQQFKIPFEDAKRLLELSILRGYGGRKTSKAMYGSNAKKDFVLRVKRRYLELAKPTRVEADEELERLKKELTEVEDQRRRKEATEKLEDEKLRILKAILRGKIKIGGKNLILETLKADPPLYKRFNAYCELKGLTPEYALYHLGCTTTNLLKDVEFCSNIEPWQKALLDSIDYLLDDEKLPSMNTLEARLYMHDHFPSRCPECNSSIKYISHATLKGERGFFIGCLFTTHRFITWLVKCPLCGSWMKVKALSRWNVLKSLVCPKCKEIWRKGRYQFWPKKYCVPVFPQRTQEAEEVKKEKREELSPPPWTPLRNFLRFNPDDIIAEINRPASEHIIDRRVIFYIREITAAGATEINFKEAAKKLGIHPNQVFYSWKRLRDKGLVW